MRRKATSIFILFFLFFSISICPVQAQTSDLVISEIMYDLEGSDGNREWVEVYNSGPEPVEVLIGTSRSAWRFFDGANHTLNLVQGTTTIASGEFFILADDGANFLLEHSGLTATVFDTVMSLNNSSSSVALSFDGGATQNIQANYDSIWGGAGTGYTLEKKNLNQDSSQANWQESGVAGGTPGLANSSGHSIEPPPDTGEEGGDDVDSDEITPVDTPATSSGSTSQVNSQLAWSKIIISEFLPNPQGSDEHEWIELYNSGIESVDLTGFALQDNSTHVFSIVDDSGMNTILMPDTYLVLDKSITAISLNNTGGDAVKLYSPIGELLEKIEYSDTAPEDKSFARDTSGFSWTTKLTPGQANIFVANEAPQAKIEIQSDDLSVGKKIVFSGEASADPEEGKLKYAWDFGDETSGDEVTENHTYQSAGSFLVKLKVSDSAGATGEISQIVEIKEIVKDIKLADVAPIDFVLTDLIISEFLPNPQGSDEGEWIELYNASDKEINLSGWQLDDEEGASRPFVFDKDTKIGSQSFLVIGREQSKLTLNNTNDSVRLLTPLGEVWQEIAYEKIPEASSYAWDKENGEWFVSPTPTPGQINLAVAMAGESEADIAKVYQVAETKDLEKNESIVVQGLVLNSPQASDTSLYLADYNNGQADYQNLLEVYNSAKDWPAIKIGEVITAKGKISKTGIIPRLKIKTQEDLLVDSATQEFNWPEAIEVDNLDQEMVGSFVSVKGIVTKKSGKSIYLATGQDEEPQLKVFVGPGLKDLDIQKGQELLTSGILTSVDNSLKLLVFDQKDILLSKAVLGEKVAADQTTEVKSNNTNFILGSNRSSVVKKVLLFLGAVLVLIIVGYITNKKRQSLSN